MSLIKSENTKPEKIVRSLLHTMGYRFRLHRTDLPGKPDIVLPKHKIAIFVHGCFWHRHTGCKNATMPKTNTDFWEKKLSKNVARDRTKLLDLERLGWHVITVWECETETSSKELFARLKKLLSAPPDNSAAHDGLLMVAEEQERYDETEG